MQAHSKSLSQFNQNIDDIDNLELSMYLCWIHWKVQMSTNGQVNCKNFGISA